MMMVVVCDFVRWKELMLMFLVARGCEVVAYVL